MTILINIEMNYLYDGFMDLLPHEEIIKTHTDQFSAFEY
jgi:hypothetical protein